MTNSSFSDLLQNDRDFAIERAYLHKNVNMPNTHYHDHYEILYLQSGKRNININNALSYELNQNNIALLRPDTIHQTVSSGNTEQTRILINISQEMIKQLTGFSSQNIISCFNVPVLNLSTYDKSMLNYLFTELLDLNKQSPIYDETIKINLAKLLLTLCNIYYNTSVENEALFFNQTVMERVDFVIKYFQKNFYSTISMEELAKKLYVTETYLSRIFKKVTGTTPYKYLLNIRIINAKRHLESKQMSISDIASVCGFNSLMAFSRAFKQIQGCSPKEYQKNYRNSVL